jgi:hypothetical protein
MDLQVEQGELTGIATGKAKQERLKLEEQWRAEHAEKQAELARVERTLDALRQTKTVPFVWDIAFVEIFEGDKGGFDIVIGNPPYVRQEMIAPPTLDPDDFGGETSDRWKEQKKIYKAKLQESVAAAWPRFFRYKPGSTTFRKPDGKSDLYIYFYLHGLSLLNPNGSFCFITSNSWLDVGYGADLQEFLLKHSHVKFIFDNEKKRSFAQADVNTIIALLAPPDDRREAGLDKTARFVMFKAPFEDVLDAGVFKALETATERQSTDRWRICVRPQRDLLEEGLARDDDEEPTDTGKPVKSRGPFIKTARYEANKWGGKYLRAPEIFFTILEKGKGKLVRLGDIAEVRRGFTTGANEFFYLDDETIRHWGIEEEFLKPVLRRPKECEGILVDPSCLEFKVFLCDRPKAALKGTAALEYIKHGEAQGYHRLPTCATRALWYSVGSPKATNIAAKMTTKYRHYFPVSRESILVDARFYEIRPRRSTVEGLAMSLNSMVVSLWLEATGRSYGGGGGPLDIKVYEIKNALLLNPDLIPIGREFWDQPALQRPVLHIWKEVELPDRRALDDVVFEVLGLTAGEREAVYEAVISLVRARLEKARSV